jgi:hypothetical protein
LYSGIASGARQSSAAKQGWIASSLALLAMTMERQFSAPPA